MYVLKSSVGNEEKISAKSQDTFSLTLLEGEGSAEEKLWRWTWKLSRAAQAKWENFFWHFPFLLKEWNVVRSVIWSAFSMKSLTFLQQFHLLGWLYFPSVSFTSFADEIPLFPYFASSDRRGSFIEVQGTFPVFWNADLGIYLKRRFIRNSRSHESLLCFNSTVPHRTG